MPFKKGQSGNPKGRKKGAENKNSKAIKDKYQQLLDGYDIVTMQGDLMELTPADRLKIVSGLLAYYIPKQTHTTLDTPTPTKIIFENVSKIDSSLLEDKKPQEED